MAEGSGMARLRSMDRGKVLARGQEAWVEDGSSGRGLVGQWFRGSVVGVISNMGCALSSRQSSSGSEFRSKANTGVSALAT